MTADTDLSWLHELRAQAGHPMEVLAARRGLDEREAASCLAQAFAMPFYESDRLLDCQPDFSALSLARAQQRRAVLLQDPAQPGQLVGVIGNPFDADLMALLESTARTSVVFGLATPQDIHAFLNQHEAGARAMDDLGAAPVSHAEAAEGVEVLSLATLSDAASPAVRLVNSTLYDALRAGASDVHIEATPAGLAVRFRVDGVLDLAAEMPGEALAEQVISRLKVLSDLDISERRVPQDGSFRVRAQARDIDLRVSIMPSVHGEDAVIRILDKQAMVEAHGRLTLDALGFDGASLALLRELMEAPYGMMLVTGPTGSGKTTTLYAALSESITGHEKVITIEDPVEYQLPGVLQIPVNEKKGLTFARGLRSILRHDPDRIMVGEIRDRETAEIAIQSALTGHMVLSTVHANNVFDVFGRFTHMGLDPYSLVSALNGIWAQRLLRVNCPHCAKPVQPSEAEKARFRVPAQTWTGFDFRRGSGCGDCRGTGYKGRKAVAEILRLDEDIRELLIQKRPMRQVREAAREAGTRTLTDAGLAMVQAGLTTLEEVRRVTLSA
ncbi:MAG: type II/IV secretion system protein [Burkholderiaceae bacterium]|nr:MAG: type II/IV secretion system protein [Burkholderiaceae bacterium]